MSSTGIPDFSRLVSRGKSPLLQDHPSVGSVQNLIPQDFQGVKLGTLQFVDKDGVYWLQEESGTKTILPAIISFPYSNSVDASGIVMVPKEGCKVAYQCIMKEGRAQALVLGYISSLKIPKDPSKTLTRDPQFEWFTDDKGNPVQLSDNGFEPGDMMICGQEGNKIKIHADGRTLLKSTAKNFIDMYPDERRYSWCKDNMDRTPGSYRGDFNNITTVPMALNSFHYHTEKHYVSPVDQTITYQEESGLVDKFMTMASGEFDDVPNPDVAASAAVNAKTANTAAVNILAGYSVFKRKVFDSGGRVPNKLPRSSRMEYFCEEIKTDGAYRVRIGAKPLDNPKAALAVEVYYKPSGEWSIGSPLGRIKVGTDGEMMFSTGTKGGATKEISIGQIIEYMEKHVHGIEINGPLFAAAATAPLGLAASAAIQVGIPMGVTSNASIGIEPSKSIPSGTSEITNNANTVNIKIGGIGSIPAYAPITSNLPDPNLTWNT